MEEYNTRDESSDMSPECHPSGSIAERGEAAEKLQQKPVTEHEERRNNDPEEEEAEKNQHMHPVR